MVRAVALVDVVVPLCVASLIYLPDLLIEYYEGEYSRVDEPLVVTSFFDSHVSSQRAGIDWQSTLDGRRSKHLFQGFS